MKKSVLRSFAVSALSLAGSTAFAQENTNKVENRDQKVALDSSNATGTSLFSQEQIDALKKEMGKKDVTENKVTFAGVVQLNGNTSDSQRSSSPDFSASKVRLGINVSGGIASGQVEVQLNGNQQNTLPVTTSNGTTTAGPDQGNNSVSLRRAQLNLDVLTIKSSESTFTTTISLGGIRTNGADGTAPDAAWTVTGYGRQDGVYLKETAAFGKTANIEIGVGAFNNIVALGNPAYPTGATAPGYTGWGSQNSFTKQENWMSSSFNQSLGFAGHVAANFSMDDNQSLAAKVFFGTQGNSPTVQNTDGTLKNVRDVSHAEASLVYNHGDILGNNGVISGNGVSFWYENENIGKLKTAVANTSGDFNYTTSTDDSQIVTIYGLGVAADSKNYLTGMLQKGDRLTYAAAYVMMNTSFGSTASSQSYNINQTTASVGYAVNTFEAAFNVEYGDADTTVYSDSNGALKQKNTIKSYLTAAYVF